MQMYGKGRCFANVWQGGVLQMYGKEVVWRKLRSWFLQEIKWLTPEYVDDSGQKRWCVMRCMGRKWVASGLLLALCLSGSLHAKSCREYYFDKETRKAGTYVVRGVAIVFGATIGVLGAIAGTILSAGAASPGTVPTALGIVAIGANAAGIAFGGAGLAYGSYKLASPLTQVKNNRYINKVLAEAETYVTAGQSQKWEWFVRRNLPRAAQQNIDAAYLGNAAQIILKLDQSQQVCYVINLEEDTHTYFSFKPFDQILSAVNAELNRPSALDSLL
ncbi:MAG: hypothetical protein HYW48_03995 [Deltaproteobacteria bacterium]|nr:hypothetical protein [Deltaproteobacteria bacterium]